MAWVKYRKNERESSNGGHFIRIRRGCQIFVSDGVYVDWISPHRFVELWFEDKERAIGIQPSLKQTEYKISQIKGGKSYLIAAMKFVRKNNIPVNLNLIAKYDPDLKRIVALLSDVIKFQKGKGSRIV